MKNENIYSHLTAKEREKQSFPISWLHKKGFIKGTVLDYGCGHGKDVEFLKSKGLKAVGFDPHYKNEYPNGKFDTITCIYVLNVVNTITQSDILMSVSELLKSGGKAYFVVRRDITKEGFRMHYVHKKPTYQTNVKLPYKSIYQSESCEIYEYEHLNLRIKNQDCIFCTPKRDIILENGLSYAMYDKFPVSPGHALIIPKSHKSSYFDLSLNEQISLTLVVNRLKQVISTRYKPDGFNIGINIGETAGQTINHVHIHLIPRYKNDIPNPVGGVRNVIPEKGDYLK